MTENAPFLTQVINLGFKTEAISKGNFPLDCRWIGDYLLVNYPYLFLVNQQSALWPSGVEDEKCPYEDLIGIFILLELFLIYGSAMHWSYQVLITTKPSEHRSLV